jgi:hypothetical protein
MGDWEGRVGEAGKEGYIMRRKGKGELLSCSNVCMRSRGRAPGAG